MSAFLVSEHHIDVLVRFAASNRYGFNIDNYKLRTDEVEDLNTIGRILWTENAKSVGYRYHAPPVEGLDTYEFKPGAPLLPPLVILKQLDCLEYQSCEHEDWEKSQAHKLVQALRKQAISSLPGYDAAPWGIDDAA